MVSARLTMGVAGVIGAAIALSACGGDEDGSSASAGTAPASTVASTTEPVAGSTAAPASSTEAPATTDAATACAGDDEGVHEVPAEYPTIQAAGRRCRGDVDGFVVDTGCYQHVAELKSPSAHMRPASVTRCRN